MFEWIVLGMVIIALLAAAWFFSSRGDSTPHNGAGADAPTTLVLAATG